MSPSGTSFRASLGGLPSAFWVLFWGMIVNRSASFVLTFLSLHLKQDLGLSHAQSGHIVALWGLGATVFSLFAGVLADRIGRRIRLPIRRANPRERAGNWHSDGNESMLGGCGFEG
jgi:MFS family permease